MFYIRSENSLLLMYKSYIPLIESDIIRLPFWEYKLSHPDIKQKFEEIFESEEENICIIGYSV